MQADAYWVAGPWPGRLAVLTRPWGGDWLEDYVRAWKALPLSCVVSALTKEEAAELQLVKEEGYCTANGIAFVSCPIPDRGIPDSVEDVRSLVFAMHAFLDSGNNVGVHCRMGVGRSAIVAASCLVQWGLTGDEALKRIANARGCPVPDTDEQREWVHRFGRGW